LLLLLLALAGCQRAAGEPPATAATNTSVGDAPSADDPVPPAPADAGPLPIVWRELEVHIQRDTAFEPWMMTTAVKSLDGQTIRITGYMHAGVFQTDNIREFVLLRDSNCPFGREGEAHHAMLVELPGDLRTSYTNQPLTLAGTFHVRPWNGPDGTTWALYHLTATSVEPGEVRAIDKATGIHGQEASRNE
jgi:hypothetical protein